MPQPTDRPQNECGDCRHTWFPKGSNLSRKCPHCGSDRVGFIGDFDGPKPREQRRRSGCLGWGFALGVLALCLVCSGAFIILGRKSEPKPAAPPAVVKPADAAEPFRAGETLTVTPAGEDYSPAAATPELLAAYLKARADKDVATDARMARLNEVVFVKRGLKAVVLSGAGGTVRATVIGEDHDGKALHFPAGNLTR